jgi:hypothetical protein
MESSNSQCVLSCRCMPGMAAADDVGVQFALLSTASMRFRPKRFDALEGSGFNSRGPSSAT